jgi:fermentation-respiration switch protein FrsA (DUF1100 family)
MNFLRRLLVAYLIVIAVFSYLQRQMMYPAARAASLSVEAFPELEQYFHTATDLEITTGDKVTIKGWHLQVKATQADRLILLFHGNGGHRAHRGSWYDIARTLNADVLVIDYHGYGDSGGSPSEKALIQDAAAAWEYAVATLKYQTAQIVIVGESLGGAAGVQLAAEKCRRGTPPCALVLVATFSSMVDVASYQFPWLPVRFFLIDRYHSDKNIVDVTCPILQFHGDQDTVVPLRFGQRLHQLAPAVSSGGKAKALHILQGTGHNDILHLHGWSIRDAMATFIR